MARARVAISVSPMAANACAAPSTPSCERSLRAYRLYLAGCAMAFEHGWIALHQILAQPPAAERADELDEAAGHSYPWRRDYMYDESTVR